MKEAIPELFQNENVVMSESVYNLKRSLMHLLEHGLWFLQVLKQMLFFIINFLSSEFLQDFQQLLY
jgi:hypothetical protein